MVLLLFLIRLSQPSPPPPKYGNSKLFLWSPNRKNFPVFEKKDSQTFCFTPLSNRKRESQIKIFPFKEELVKIKKETSPLMKKAMTNNIKQMPEMEFSEINLEKEAHDHKKDLMKLGFCYFPEILKPKIESFDMLPLDCS